jgi:hypothetical protein
MRGSAETFSTVEKSHGRVEVRSILVCSMPPFHGWEHARQCFKLVRTVSTRGGLTTRVHVYGITSLPAAKAGPEQLLAIARGHWGIEASHWLRDTVLREDASTLRKGHSPHLNAIANALTLCIFHALGFSTTEGIELMADDKVRALDAIQG